MSRSGDRSRYTSAARASATRADHERDAGAVGGGVRQRPPGRGRDRPGARGRAARPGRRRAGDARCIVARLVAEASVAAYHLYFPDPWPKTRHRARRLTDPSFAAELARTLAPSGVLHLASDLRHLVDRFAAVLAAAGLVPERGAVPPLRPTTAFERKYAQA